ncbi:sugar phosphate permease [Roseimicrobium gellanilyticum]|uniref:Sugar phosphate permease n=1 Tax=Roseimicrobium gellanilyticum TaxID=748857 RepID=A0A366HT24_9BACT|nr:MFS transporter [Roseimicrobium gellanilyticum]RBP46073.1 sugar phosphate permease [Roseimicrobium gellanilyticum]
MTASFPSSSTLRYAWIIVALLFPVALLNYLDRQMIASMKVSVMKDIPSVGSEENWGHMLAQFKWVYAFFSPIGGYIADRFSKRYTICTSLFVWSAITWWTGHASSFQELMWARSLMGISEAFYIPAALALIADYHSTLTRSRAVSIHQMGIYCGVIVGGFAGYVADAPSLGWRWAFDVTGIVGVLYAIPLLIFLRDKSRFGTGDAAAAAEPVQENELSKLGRALRLLFGNASFILLVLYFTLPAIAAWVVRDWMPAILQKEFNISQGKAGVSAALYWQAAALVSAIFAGWLADRWMRRTQRGRIYVSALGMALIVPALFSVGNAPGMHSFGLAIFGLILFGMGWGFFDINNMPILSQIVRPDLRATGYGIMNFVSMMFGGVADWSFGYMRDRHVPLNVIFTAFAGVCVLSALLVLMIRPRDTETSHSQN